MANDGVSRLVSSYDSYKQKRLVGIQILRICACIGVFLVHLGQRLRFTGAIRTLTDFGAFGVEMFFIISGYLAFRGGIKHGYKNTLKYYIKRAIRLLPLFYLVTIFYFISDTFIWHTIEDKSGWIRELFITNGLINPNGWRDTGGTWTIHIFVCFYLIVPILARIVKSTKSALVFLLISYLAGHFTLLYGNGWLNFLVYLPYFSMGILLFFSEKEKCEIKVSLFLVLFSLTSIIFSRKEEMIYSPLFCLIILIINKISWKGIIIRIVNCLDPYTYSLYLTHCVVVCGVLDKLPLSKLSAYLIGILGSILLTIFIYHTFEKPIYSFLRKRVEKSFNEKSIQK